MLLQTWLQGIGFKRLAVLERRLQRDCLRESASNNGNILVHDEVRTQEIRPCWEVRTVDTLAVDQT